MNRTRLFAGAAAAVAAACFGIGFACAQQSRQIGYTDTPFLPGGKWRVHDGTRPQPKVIDPGTASTQETPGRPPSDAVVLFDGTDLSKWKDDKGRDARWTVENGAMIANKTGSITTKQEYPGDCQLHVEWATPNPPRGIDQGRGNSGVFVMGRYEIQVLDNFENQTYPDGQAGSVYGQHPPMVNACRKPGEWQVYDIFFTAPRFKDGKLESPAYVTVVHNGVVVQNHAEVLGGATHKVLPKYEPHGLTGPVSLQDHGDPVRFRNIWIRELKSSDEQ